MTLVLEWFDRISQMLQNGVRISEGNLLAFLILTYENDAFINLNVCRIPEQVRDKLILTRITRPIRPAQLSLKSDC